jgi:CarD family transcriptional regulator
MSKKLDFSTGDYVVYPTHGVGKITGIEMQQIAEVTVELIIIKFEKDRMTLRVPVEKAHNSGLRRLSSRKMMDTALTTLKGRSRAKRTMWSRRAQEYEAKINSGDPVSIAEVVRDLHRGREDRRGGCCREAREAAEGGLRRLGERAAPPGAAPHLPSRGRPPRRNAGGCRRWNRHRGRGRCGGPRPRAFRCRSSPPHAFRRPESPCTLSG